MKKLFFVGGIFLVAFSLFYLPFVHFVDQYQVAITRNLFTGELQCDTKGGFHFTAPWVQATRIDTRPIRVCITSASRAYNCKLAQFEPAYHEEFIRVQGFQYYWWANRVSFNFGYNEEYRGMKDILRGYAYGASRYQFIKITQDYSGP